MSINILGGRVSGHALFVPKGDATRPTTVMLRRKFFDAHQNCENIVFVDICAGTGAMALEAVSRGSDKVYCIEKDKYVFATLKKNVKEISVKVPEATIYYENQDGIKFLKHFLQKAKSYTEEEQENVHLYLDPPYEDKRLYTEAFKLICENDFLGTIWIESDRQKGIIEEDVKKLGHSFTKVYKQGTSYIAKVALNS